VSLFRRKRKAAERPRLRLFVAADVHGSDVCFRKFVNAGAFYGVDALVLGGDITGKALVALVEEAGGRYRVRFMGRERVLEGGEVGEVERLIRFNGFYPYRCRPEEAAALHGDEAAVAGAFEQAMRRQVEEWVELAEERLDGTGIACFVMPGNDDLDFVPDVLAKGRVLQDHDAKVLEIDGLRIAGYGWSNPTPWETPREKPEEEIEGDLRELLGSAGDPRTLIFNPHVPPFDTGIDLAPELTPDLTMVMDAGQPRMVPVGSRAVRAVIEDYQPLLVLSGHIHESRGIARIGRTICVNPGSEYNVGRLLGAIVEIGETGVGDVQLVAG
jgi:Icc-related predicted phosphoesterase